MKTPLAILLALAVLFAGLPLGAQNMQTEYNEGVKLFNSGNYGEALIKFESVLKARPDYVYARSYAARCKTALAQNAGPTNNLEGQLARIVLPSINFADAPLGDVLDYFSARATEISNGQTTVNFIYKGTTEQRSGTLITLSLRNVPMTEAIKYVGELSKSRISYEPHAVVVDPGTATTPAAPATGETEAKPKPQFD